MGRLFKIKILAFMAQFSVILLFNVGIAKAASPEIGSVIILTAVNGNYVSADNNGNELIANITTVGDFEKFEVIDAGNGEVGLKCLGNGMYVCAEDGGDSPLMANRNRIGSWEKFTIQVSGDKIGFIASINGRYVCAEDNGGSSLIANRDKLGSWESFDYSSEDSAPTVTFVEPSSSNASSDLGVVVEASGPDGSISHVLLYIDDAFVRRENAYPYEWGTANANSDDALLLNLANGTHQLRAEAFDNDGAKSTVMLTVAVDDQDTQGGMDVVYPDDVTFDQPYGIGPVISPIFGYNWTSGRIKDYREDGENYYEWPVYNHYTGNKIMDRNCPEYWDTFVDEMLLARITVVSFHHRGPKVGDMHVKHVKKFIEAAERAGVRDQFKIAYFEDTGMHGNNVKYSSNGATGSQLDCSSKKHQEYLYLDYYREFFKTIPRDMWYTYNGRPLINAWNAMSDLKNRQDLSEMLTYCANRFKDEFGVKPLWVLQDNWFRYDSRLNNSSLVLGKHKWFSSKKDINRTYATHNGFKTGLIVPGYKKSLSNIVNGNNYRMKRWSDGKNIATEAFEEGIDADLILLEGWTNLIESAGWYRSEKWKYPAEYINIVRHYTDPEPDSLRFQAEGADRFKDNTSGNTFGDYSKRDLDVKRFEVTSGDDLVDSGWYVDDTENGEWLEYQNVEVGGDTYRFTARVATNGPGKKMKLALPGASTIELPDTNGAFQLVHLGQVDLSQGTHDFRINFYSKGIKLDWFFMKRGGLFGNVNKINFNTSPPSAYGGSQDVKGQVQIKDGGSTLFLSGNRWQKINFQYTITPDTVITFDFGSDARGEVHAIGFDTDTNLSENRGFKLYGSQKWAVGDYSYSGSGIEHFSIPVGQYYTGDMQYLFFANDHDVANSSAQSRFSNIEVYEDR